MNFNSYLQEHSPKSMRLNNNSSSASVASRLYTNGTRGSRRGSFGSETEQMSYSDNETSIHELNEICTQVCF